MSNLTVAVIGPEGYAQDLGKKGTSSDITFYNLKKGDNTITFLEPTRYPERLASLFFSVSLASRAILVVDGKLHGWRGARFMNRRRWRRRLHVTAWIRCRVAHCCF